MSEKSVVALGPPQGLDDEWSRWLVGEWESSSESDQAGFKSWVRGTGRVKVEVGIGGQFLMVTKQGRVTHLSDEYVQHLRQTTHAAEEEIDALRRMTFAGLEVFTIDSRAGGIVGHLFDSWRCVASGAGRREGDKEFMEWTWSVAGQGTSVRTTERVDHDTLCKTLRCRVAGVGQRGGELETCGAKRVRKAEILKWLVDAGEEERGDFLRRQMCERATVLLVKVAASVSTSFRVNRESGNSQRVEIAQNRTLGYLKLRSQTCRRRTPSRLQVEQDGQEPVGAHETSLQI
ncbi:MAG: hypothetical protein MUC88_25140 [Planctomycetes bacterium]|nr:hypothetical protein [Planctomycetota bacterium]